MIVFERAGVSPPVFEVRERFGQELGVLGLVSNPIAEPTALDEVLGLDDVRIVDAVVTALLRNLAADPKEVDRLASVPPVFRRDRGRPRDGRVVTDAVDERAVGTVGEYRPKFAGVVGAN